MSYGFMGIGMIFLTIPILIGQWVGILSLGKVQRDAAWWWMMCGIASTTLGAIGSAVYMGLMMSGTIGFMGGGTYSMIAASGLSGLGSLLFTIGFALHGMHASRRFQRISELEAIAAAQGEELNRHRAAYESAN